MKSGYRFLGFAALLSGAFLLQSTAAGAAPRKHAVVAGESLWKIAHQNGVDVATLRKANGMKEGDVLRAGQTLTIPEATGKPKRAAAADAPKPKAGGEATAPKTRHKAVAKAKPKPTE